jgi:hypothetical protein
LPHAGFDVCASDGGYTSTRAFLGDETFVGMTRYPLDGSAKVMTRTMVPAGAAVLQSTVAMGTASGEPEGAMPAQAPAALWDAVQRQGRGVVIRAAGMKAGAQPAATGEMYDFKWQGAETVLVRRFPGSG